MAWTWDAAPVRIVAPSSNNVDSGTVVAPSAVVINLGDSTASFPVLFSITPDYLDTADVVDLNPGDSVVVTFVDWTALQRGTATAACSTALSVDESTANDRIFRDLNVRVRDVGVDQIIAPVGIINLGLTVTPEAKVTNHSTNRASFWATFRIGESYVDSLFVFRLAAGDSRDVSFADWTADSLGTFAVVCTAAMNSDVYPANDLVEDSVQTVVPGISTPDLSLRIPRVMTLSGTGPFAERVAIEYGLPRSADLRLEVYDACGRLVQVVAAGVSQPGYHTAVWQCTDQHGRAVAEGAYFVRLTADGVTLTNKVVKTE